MKFIKKIIGKFQLKDIVDVLNLYYSKPKDYILNSSSIEQYTYNFLMYKHIRDKLYISHKEEKLIKEKTYHLIKLINNEPYLEKLSKNLGLLKFIIIFYTLNYCLPELKIDFYREISDIVLLKQPKSESLSNNLSTNQKKFVLRNLSLELMKSEIIEFSLRNNPHLKKILKHALSNVTDKKIEIEPLDFLRYIQDSSNLLLQKEKEQFSFTHLSFQEYFASLEVKFTEDKNILLKNINNPWWHNTIKFYSSHTQPIAIVEALQQKPTEEKSKLSAECINLFMATTSKNLGRKQLTKQLNLNRLKID